MATATKSFESRVAEAKSKREVTEMVERAYASTERHIQPLKPFLLVRTLPRSTSMGGVIVLPEKQNKPNLEGVVLAVFKPYWEKVEETCKEDGKHYDISVYNECDVKVGDHIVFPHFVGLPDSFLDDQEYRLIKEDDAIAVLHYREKDATLKEVVSILLEHSRDKITHRYNSMAKALMEKFDLVPKGLTSQTTSGK